MFVLEGFFIFLRRVGRKKVEGKQKMKNKKVKMLLRTQKTCWRVAATHIVFIVKQWQAACQDFKFRKRVFG